MGEILFKKGDIVYHQSGGRGEIRSIEMDWSTDPPRKVAVVRVIDTVFHTIRKIPVEDLHHERRKR